MGSGGPGRQAGKAPEGKREGFFLKNPEAKRCMRQFSTRKMLGVCG